MAWSPIVSSMSWTVTPLFARLITSDSRSRTPISTATSLSWIAARMAGRSGVTGSEDPIRDREGREVDLAVGRVEVDDDRVDQVPRLGDGIAHAFALERGMAQRDRLRATTTRIPRRMGLRDVEQGLVGVAGVLVGPAVRRGAPAGQAERQPDVAGDGVGVDQEDLHLLAQLEHGREIRRDRRLAHAALRVEHREDRGGGRPLGVEAAHQRGPRRWTATSGPGRGSPSPRCASEAHRRSTAGGRSRRSRPCRRPGGRRARPRRRGTGRTGGRLGRAAPRRRWPRRPQGRPRHRRRRRSWGCSR